MDVAVDIGVSTRHLSFVETGRSRPSPELLLTIARHLNVPLREQNTLLLAAGYAPRYSERPLNDPEMAPIMTSIQRILDAHDPYPGVVVDRLWNVITTNRAGSMLIQGIPDHVLGPELNVYRLCLHPDGLARRTTNFIDWGAYLLLQLRRSVSITNDQRLIALLDEVMSYPNVAELAPLAASVYPADLPVLVPFTMITPAGELSMFSMMTTFGTPLDITIDELAIELFFPSDSSSESLLRAAQSSARDSPPSASARRPAQPAY